MISTQIRKALRMPRTMRYALCDEGFTLLEVLVSVSILSCSLIFIFHIFFGVAYGLDHLNNRFDAGLLLEEEIWEAKNILRKDVYEEVYEKNVSCGDDGRYNISIKMTKRPDFDDLYTLAAGIAWTERDKKIVFKRESYERPVFK